MNYQDALEKLASVNQSQLLKYYDELTSDQKTRLLLDIELINLDTLQTQQHILAHSNEQSVLDFLPFPPPSISGNAVDIFEGKKMISEGLMGCLIVAGGQGTRLRSNGPKGTFPITPYEHKSLFQLFAEKTAAASRQAQRALPLAIMTSPINHKETVVFFEEHNYFGLNPQQVSFFSQGTLPFLDEHGNLFLESKNSLAMGPDGNGLALHHFYRSGIWKSWYDQGVRALNFIVVDNPLADPFDAELIGHHRRCGNEITIKCVHRKHALEKVGVLAQLNQGKDHSYLEPKLTVVEYSELPKELAEKVQPDGSLLFACANISLFCFQMDFIKTIALHSPPMPLHKAFKAVSYVDENGQIQQSKEPRAWKFEAFIFDLLPLAKKISALLYPREECFSPLKNYEGDDSIITVRQALKNNDRRVFTQITGLPGDTLSQDLPQDFYYPTPEFLKKTVSFFH